MDKVKIEIHTGRTKDGIWYAICHDIPWLATEGESYIEATNIIAKIAPKLIAQENIHAPLQLVWCAEASGSLQ